jgi:hypothetical protein
MDTQRKPQYLPTSMTQKRKLLDLKVVKNFHIVCSLAMSEASLRDIIRNVPTNDSEEDLLMLLTDQGVTQVKRFTTLQPDDSRTPLRTVTLFFNTQQLPREVTMAHEIFHVKQFIPRPTLCRRCWTFGHPEETCTTTPICKQCSQEHQPLTICLNPPKCPTCEKPGHAAGTLECPRFANKQQMGQQTTKQPISGQTPTTPKNTTTLQRHRQRTGSHEERN